MNGHGRTGRLSPERELSIPAPASASEPERSAGSLTAARRAVVLLVSLVSSAFFLWLVLRDAHLGAVEAALREADLEVLLAAAALIELVYVFQALRWRGLAATPSVSSRHFLALVLAGVATNNVLPLRVGDLLRGRWLAKAAHVSTGRALGSVFRDRLSDVIVLVVGLLVTLPLVGSTAWVRRIAVGGAVLLLVLGLVVVAALFYARHRPRARRAQRSRLRRLVRDVLDEVASPLGRRRIAIALALSVLAWTVWAASAGLVCRSLGIHLSPVELVFVTCVINLGVAIPSSPGFVGTYQWLGVSSLALVGVDGEVALAFSLLMQAIWFVPTTVVGGPIALREAGRGTVGRRRRPRAASEDFAADERA